MSRRASARRDEGVSDVVGSILLVGITVVMMVALALLVSRLPAPTDEVRTTVATDVHPGPDRVWDTGDEQVRVRNVGGEALRTEASRIIVEIEGARTDRSADALGGPFADGRLTIGETWVLTAAIGLGDEVLVDVITGHGTQLVGSASLVASPLPSFDCSGDTAPPVVAQWTQTPADVNILTTGAVTVRVRLTDLCAGVDPGVAPELRWRVNDGTDPALTNAGAMSPVAPGEWQGTIPAQTWSLHLGKTLEYLAFGMTDLNGNAGNSPLRQDIIGITGTTTPVAAAGVTTGSLSNFANMQDAADGGAFATMQEDNTGQGVQNPSLSANAVVSAVGWTNPGNAFTSNDQRATASGNSPQRLEVGLADTTATGAVTQVSLHAEVHASKTSSNWRLQACLGAVCSTQSADLGSPTADTVLSYTVTALRPGGGSWTVADLNNLQVRVQPSGSGNPTYRVDHVYATATVDGTAYRMDMTAEWNLVPPATSQYLELRYRTTGDTFQLQVWNGAAWTTRATLGATSMTILYYQLTAAEYNLGSPMVRFVDSTASATQGSLLVDYARVVSG